MGTRLVNIDRQTPMLLPEDLRDWVAQDDLVQLIVEAVELCDLRGARLNERGSGSAQYPPSMMLGLLIYCYATKIFGSRQIERATYESVAVRYLCANHHPDHDTICEFRRQNRELFERCLVQVLLMAKEAGVLRVGSIALDGTRLAGAGAKNAVRRLSDIEAELGELGAELLAQAEVADATEDHAQGTQLPGELGDRGRRRAKLLAAREQIEARRRAAREAGTQDQPGGATRSDRASVSEPQSRTLRGAGQGGPWVQGYNAQAASDVGGSGLILGAHLSDAANDAGQICAGLQSIAMEVGHPAVVLADSGYDATADIALAEAEHGVLVLCPPQRRPNSMEQRRRHARAQKRWERRRQMEARLRCPLLGALYRRRQSSAEGVFARIKGHLGFRRFHCWGLQGARAEWQLLCLAHNCRQLARRRHRS
jgi:transposase